MKVCITCMVLVFLTHSLTSDPDMGCCKTRKVGGFTYNLLRDQVTREFPTECHDRCAYTRDGEDASPDYCFKPGSLSSSCVGDNNEVSCGAHAASSCALCPGKHGKAWCNGDCQWESNTCKPKTRKDPNLEPWLTEWKQYAQNALCNAVDSMSAKVDTIMQYLAKEWGPEWITLVLPQNSELSHDYKKGNHYYWQNECSYDMLIWTSDYSKVPTRGCSIAEKDQASSIIKNAATTNGLGTAGIVDLIKSKMSEAGMSWHFIVVSKRTGSMSSYTVQACVATYISDDGYNVRLLIDSASNSRSFEKPKSNSGSETLKIMHQ